MDILHYIIATYAAALLVGWIVTVATWALIAFIHVQFLKHAMRDLLREAEYMIRRNQQDQRVTKESAMRSYEENERRYGPQPQTKQK